MGAGASAVEQDPAAAAAAAAARGLAMRDAAAHPIVAKHLRLHLAAAGAAEEAAAAAAAAAAQMEFMAAVLALKRAPDAAAAQAGCDACVANFVADGAPQMLAGADAERAAALAAAGKPPEEVLGPLLAHVEAAFEAGAWATFAADEAAVAALLKEKPLKMVGAKMNPETGRLVLG